MSPEQKVAFLYPGQNSAEEGMNKPLRDDYCDLTAEIFKKAEKTLAREITQLCLDGTEEDYGKSDIAQPAVLITSLAWSRVIKKERKIKKPAIVAGHSLGTYTALVEAGSLLPEDAIKLVYQRGKLMDEAAKFVPSTMVVIMRRTKEQVQEICAQTGTEIANYNSRMQFVVAGRVQDIIEVEKIVLAHNATAIRLNIGVLSHCSLAEPTARQFATILQKVDIETPQIPFIANETADYVKTAKGIRTSLVDQITQAVHWDASVVRAVNDGATILQEVGPKESLTKLNKRIVGENSLKNVEYYSTAQALEKVA